MASEGRLLQRGDLIGRCIEEIYHLHLSAEWFPEDEYLAIKLDDGTLVRMHLPPPGRIISGKFGSDEPIQSLINLPHSHPINLHDSIGRPIYIGQRILEVVRRPGWDTFGFLLANHYSFSASQNPSPIANGVIDFAIRLYDEADAEDAWDANRALSPGLVPFSMLPADEVVGLRVTGLFETAGYEGDWCFPRECFVELSNGLRLLLQGYFDGPGQSFKSIKPGVIEMFHKDSVYSGDSNAGEITGVTDGASLVLAGGRVLENWAKYW